MHAIFEKDTGKVLGISSTTLTENSIPVDISQVIGIIEGTDSKKNYRVEYNAKTKQLELTDKHKQRFDGATVNDFIYEVPEVDIDDADITVEQDIPNTCWRFTVGKTLKKNLRSKGIRINSLLHFAITKKHDPNILYKTLRVDLSRILDQNSVIIPFDHDFEKQKAVISIFTARKFDSYKFKRIFDE